LATTHPNNLNIELGIEHKQVLKWGTVNVRGSQEHQVQSGIAPMTLE
jgi:hypothetical protein